MYTAEGKLTVQGTAIVRVEPDLASVGFAVSRTAPTPADAFAGVKEASGKVRTFLEAASCQIRSSQILLHQEFPRGPSDQRELGYVATARFSLVISELDAVEKLLSEIVSLGVNNLASVEFLTSRLKEIRAEARKKAVSAAKEKATLYCEVAGLQLGPIVGLSEGHFDPRQRPGGHVPSSNVSTDVDDRIGTFSPSSIPVGATVTIAFKLM